MWRDFLFFILVVLMALACQNSEKKQHAKADVIKPKKETIIYYTYGEFPPIGYLYFDTLIVTPQYNFKVKNLGGCVPNSANYNVAISRNIKTKAQMEQKYGKNWITRFEYETKFKLIFP